MGTHFGAKPRGARGDGNQSNWYLHKEQLLILVEDHCLSYKREIYKTMTDFPSILLSSLCRCQDKDSITQDSKSQLIQNPNWFKIREILRSKKSRSEIFRSKKFRSDKSRSEKFRSEESRSENFRSQKFRSEKPRSEVFRSETFRFEKFKSEKFRSERFRSKKSRSEIFRSEKFKSKIFRSKIQEI